MTGVLIRRVDTETHRKEGYVRTEAEIGAMLPQAKEHQALPSTTGGWKRQGRVPEPSPSPH